MVRHIPVMLQIRAPILTGICTLENEEAVGKVIRESGIPREEIFVTTKLKSDHNWPASPQAHA